MTLHVPRNTPYIQEHVTLTTDEHVLERHQHADADGKGKVEWRCRRKSSHENRNGGDDDRGKDGKEVEDGSWTFLEEEVVFICQEDGGGSDEPTAASSATASESEPPESEQQQQQQQQQPPEPVPSTHHHRYAIYLVRENPGNSDEPFRLWVVSGPAGLIPQELVERHLLEKTPAHLTSSPDGPDLHVIVSTKSGTGLAQAVYASVLQKLLAVLGLRPRPAGDDDYTPPESPGGGSNAASVDSDGCGPADTPDLSATVTVPSSARPYNLFVTRSRRSIRDLAHAKWGLTTGQQQQQRELNSRGQLIILLSGDGGVVDLLNGTGDGDRTNSSSLPTIALLPLGTGNALFHSLHRPLNQRLGTSPGPSHLVLGLRTLFRGISAPLPTFRASFSPGSTLVPHPDDLPPLPQQQQEEETTAAAKHANDNVTGTGTGTSSVAGEPVTALLGAIVASYGFHAQLVWESDTPSYRRHGAARFGMAAQELLAVDHAYDAAVEVRRQSSEPASGCWSRLFDDHDEKLTYVLAAMVSNLERHFTINPAAKPLDGRLRLVSFGAVGAEQTMEIMRRAYSDGAHVDMLAAIGDNSEGDGKQQKKKLVGYEEVEEVRVVVREADARWRKVCVDGTIVEIPRDGWMAVERTEGSRFRVLVDGSVL